MIQLPHSYITIVLLGRRWERERYRAIPPSLLTRPEDVNNWSVKNQKRGRLVDVDDSPLLS